MGLDGQPAFTLDQITQLIKLIHGTYDPPYSIIIYSLYSMGEVQRSVEEAVNKSVEGSQEKVQVTNFVMVKVRVRHTLSYIIPRAVRDPTSSITLSNIFTSFFALDKFLYCYVCRTPLKMAAPGAGPTRPPTWFRKWWWCTLAVLSSTCNGVDTTRLGTLCLFNTRQSMTTQRLMEGRFSLILGVLFRKLCGQPVHQ